MYDCIFWRFPKFDKELSDSGSALNGLAHHWGASCKYCLVMLEEWWSLEVCAWRRYKKEVIDVLEVLYLISFVYN